jgi:hypothetical protein
MSRKLGWWAASGIVSILCVVLFLWNHKPAPVLEDSDTAFIVHEMNRVNNPWRWFNHDWPLLNHFYRPLSTLVFEFDNRVYGMNAAGWAVTSALLAVFATLALFWFLRELTDSPALSVAGTTIFFFWEISRGEYLAAGLAYVLGVILVVGLWHLRRQPGLFKTMDRAVTIKIRKARPPAAQRFQIVFGVLSWAIGKVWLQYKPLTVALLVWVWVYIEAPGLGQSPGSAGIATRILEWYPGRTASLTTALALVGIAAFTRFLRLSPRRSAKATAVEVPQTRNASPPRTRPPSIFWPLLACIAEALALLSYEQAVVIPAIFGLLAIFWHFRGTKVKWAWGIPFGILLVAYLIVRREYVPQGHSWYYDWQKRTPLTSIWFLQHYLFFFVPPVVDFCLFLGTPIMLFISLGPATAALNAVAAATAFYQARKRWFVAGVGWLGSSLAYAPMAPFKDFEHYHYLPEALRSIFYVTLVWIAFDLTVTAFAPRARQAPLRLSPAPGSLPRP